MPHGKPRKVSPARDWNDYVSKGQELDQQNHWEIPQLRKNSEAEKWQSAHNPSKSHYPTACMGHGGLHALWQQPTERNLGPMVVYALRELEEQVRAVLLNQKSGFVRKRNPWNSGIYISLFSELTQRCWANSLLTTNRSKEEANF